MLFYPFKTISHLTGHLNISITFYYLSFSICGILPPNPLLFREKRLMVDIMNIQMTVQ